MLELMRMMLNGAEVKKTSDDVPKNVSVDLDVEKITERAPDTVLLEFQYRVTYGPKVGEVSISGTAMCRDSPENIKKLMAEHKKKKALPFEMAGNAINMINANVGMNSIFILRPFGLIPHFMPPPISVPGAEVRETKENAKKK